MSADTPAKMVPDPDGRNADFYRCAATGRLHLQRCDDCARVLHPPRYQCAGCGSEQLTFVAAQGQGTLFSWTVTHRPIDPGWAARGPWATVVVELAEGVRVVGGWRGALSELALDLPVVCEVEVVSDAFARIHFKLLGG